MRVLILLLILTASIKICKTEGETHTTIILNDSQTEMTVQQVQNSSGSPTSELFDNLREIESDGNDLDFNYDDDEETLKVGMKNPDVKEQELQEVLLKAMKKPAIRKQIGEVIPILRVMSPAQRLTLAALVSSQITSQNTLSEENLAEIAAMFAYKSMKSNDDRHNITEHLLLPISMDIAKMFKGLGKEMGRNLRQNFYRSVDSVSAQSNSKRIIIKPDFKQHTSINRRVDEIDYDQSEEQFSANKPVAEALKQPGKDECDYFTKNLCLEVSNYPFEAIISSLKKNQDIAKTFLADFEVQPAEENGYDSRNQGNGRRLERRQDGQNEVQDFAPEGGYMCPSSVKYARPKRARATSGQWKYIVNAGDYTQTLRLEMCQKPKSPCSYVTNHLNSQCTQIYNYHRLLTWDEAKGLHMDIFKVPSCCSCHIQGYSNYFPPNKDFTFAEKRKEPLEGTNLVLEPQNRSPYGYLGNKREVSQYFHNGSSFHISAKNQSHQINVKDFYKDPVDHLVPPGPPLPLENESTFNLYPERTSNQKKIYPEINRGYPVYSEYRRTTNRLIEGTDIHKELPLSSKTRLKMPTFSSSEKTNVKFPTTHHPEIFPVAFQEDNPVFDSSSQIHFLKPLPGSPPFFSNLDTVKEKSSESSVFPPPNLQKDLIFQLNVKTNPKQPPQFFKSEFIDTKGFPSRVSPSYITLPKVKGMESRVSTTSVPPQKSEMVPSSSGQKKINYNYHPIIDFFLSDSKKKQSIYSNPQYSTMTSQDWTPVLGH